MYNNRQHFQVDKKREVSTSEGESWANAHRFAYVETSAMTGEGVSKAFEVRRLLNKEHYKIYYFRILV